ncbi:MAG: fumarylacetoacetase [Simplicispira suum]|uniref:fumarylacetoacetase n=1 Tax=Simplicispira suum TaxID=2109915 RepID=UPI001C6B211B|nr:fumarylacetoacetase [Simplicispira suum]MBW7833604.1 fumarylacetoacetase [Simplicispira suum]
MSPIDHTHNPAARSWVTSANAPDGDFPIQNLPFAVFRHQGGDEAFRGGVAIGDQVIDLARVAELGCLEGLAHEAVLAGAHPYLNDLMAMGPEAARALRHGLFALLKEGADGPAVDALRGCLTPQVAVQYTVPVQVHNYTDFYTSIHHARNVGRLIRPDQPLSPNFQWLPIAYHGRASSVVVSGTDFHRPMGQALPQGASAPVYGACARLDFELEMAIYVGQGNALGEQVPLAQAEEHIFGMGLLNDWSARDHQFWEMAPLGPFLGKNFCTSVSPWVVTMDALAPYRVAAVARPSGEPQPLAYLADAANQRAGGIDVRLTVGLETAQHRQRNLPPAEITRTSFRHQYWTVAQMLTQHTVGGCNLQSGDLLGTGTISGPAPEEAGAIVELSVGGSQPLTLAGTGEQRTFLQDGDTVVLRGWCEAPGAARIGFGECRGMVLPAKS